MSGQVLIDQCDGTAHVRTKSCGNIECATNRKNITNQNSRNRQMDKFRAPDAHMASCATVTTLMDLAFFIITKIAELLECEI